MFRRVSILMFHGGHFVQSLSLKYVNGMVANFDNVDTGLFSFFEIRQIAKDLGYPIHFFTLYYRLFGVELKEV